MISHYKITLCGEPGCAAKSEWGYRLYSALLAYASQEFQEYAHQNTATPVSQFVTVKKNEDEIEWTLSLFGNRAEKELGSVLEQNDKYELDSKIHLRVRHMDIVKINGYDQLVQASASQERYHNLKFCTPTAFKSQGSYVSLPSVRLIFMNLIRKWNCCFPELQIVDEDQEGVETILSRIQSGHFRISDRIYHLKGNSITGFCGELDLENKNTGFHKELADVLLYFSGFSGIGIKTALGMGGVRHQYHS